MPVKKSYLDDIYVKLPLLKAVSHIAHCTFGQGTLAQGTLVYNIWRQCFAASLFAVLFFSAISANAIEWQLQWHQAEDSATAYSVVVADKLTRRSNFYWQSSYNNYRDIVYPWSNKDQLLPLSTLDATLGYRFNNARAQRFSAEITLGAAVSIVDVSLTFPPTNSGPLPSIPLINTGDISPIVTTAFQYKLGRNSAVTFGAKHMVSMGELADITTVYLGFSYQQGNRRYGL